MPNDNRKTISTEALLAMGGIQGLLKDASENPQSIRSGISAPSLALDGNGDIITKEIQKERQATPKETDSPVQTTAGKESPQDKKIPTEKEEEQPAKASVPVKGETKTKKEKPSVTKGKFQPLQKVEWDVCLSLLKEYDHVINRNIDRAIYIEGDLMEVFRSCFGIKACSLVNVVVRKFIEGNKERLKALRQRQCQLLE